MKDVHEKIPEATMCACFIRATVQRLQIFHLLKQESVFNS